MPSLGAPALLTGYTCGPFSCTGDTPEAQTALFQLQRLANAAAAVLGIPDRVTPDGKIGSKTVDLIQFIAVRLADDQTSTIREFWAATKAEIAEHAPALIADLTRIAESGSSLTPNLPVVGTVGPRISVPVRSVPAVSVASSGQVFVPVVKTPYLIAGVAGTVVLLLGGIAFAVSKHSSSSMAGARPRRKGGALAAARESDILVENPTAYAIRVGNAYEIRVQGPTHAVTVGTRANAEDAIRTVARLHRYPENARRAAGLRG